MGKSAEKLDLDSIQWLMLPGTEPGLKQGDFGPSKRLYSAVTKRFSLKAQFSDGVIQKAFEDFAASIRPRQVEATSVSVAKHHDMFVITGRGHKTEAASQLCRIIKEAPEVSRLLSAPDLSSVWQRAVSVEDSIVGGFDMKNNSMFFFARPPLEEAKSLFGISENHGRYKPRPERDPAFFSQGNIGVSVVQYPEQIDKAYQHLQYFLRAGWNETRQGFCCVSQDLYDSLDDSTKKQLMEKKPFNVTLLRESRQWGGPLNSGQRHLRNLSGYTYVYEAEAYLNAYELT